MYGGKIPVDNPTGLLCKLHGATPNILISTVELAYIFCTNADDLKRTRYHPSIRVVARLIWTPRMMVG